MKVKVYSPKISRIVTETDDDPVRDVVRKYIDYFVATASGNNAVAIDNKIEQAMDLVKSHLMFAVREEVEVLKEKIAELMERISHLEVENNLLRSNATPETLMQLNSLPQQVGTTAYQPTFNPATGTLM